MRHVIVDETGETTTATAFASADAARAFAIPLIEARLVAEDLRDEFPADLASVPLWQLGEYESAVLILDEGAEGVWTGFSSADRCSIGGPFPDDDGNEFYGNGDPNVYRTAGQPDGVSVAGVVTPELGCDDEDDEEDEDD